MRITLIVLLACTLLISGCGINPVTGKSQITFMSQSQEIALGEKQYGPSQQSQGGVYRVDKHLNDYVNRIGQALAKHSEQPNLPYEFVVLNNGVPNAWALPGGKIAINRGLLLIMEDEAQLAAVLGHEIVHAAARHGAEQSAKRTGIQLLGAILQSQTNNNLYQQGVALGGGAAQAHYSRSDEFDADYYSLNYMVAEGYDPQGAVELQQALVELAKDSKKSDWLSRLMATHPPSEERAKRNQKRANELPKGKRNKAAYQKAIAQVKKDQKAYELNDQADQAARKKEWDKALSLSNQAIKLQPREARFHITKGRILDSKKDHANAIKAFNLAATLEPNYFGSRFYRGVSYHANKNYKAAESDLLAANKLLETGVAYYYLGEIAENKKQRQAAITYYQTAARSGGDVGKAASARLRKMGVR